MLSAQQLLNGVVSLLFARQLLAVLGIGSSKDAFDAAFSIPFIVIAVTGLGWAHSIVISKLARLRGTPGCGEAFAAIHFFCFYASIAASLGIALCAPLIAGFLLPGSSEATRGQCGMLIQLMSPSIVGLGLTTVYSAALLAHESALSLEIGLIITRVIVIGSAYVWPADAVTLSVWLSIGSLASAFVYWWALRSTTALRCFFAFGRVRLSVVSDIWPQITAFAIAGVTAQALQIGTLRSASIMGEGVISTIGYATALAGPIVTIIGKPLYQAFASRISRDPTNHFVRRLLLISFLVSLAASALFATFSESIVSMLLGGDSLDVAGKEQVVMFSVIFLSSAPAQTLLWVCLPAMIHATFGGGLLSPLLYAFQNTAVLFLIWPLCVLSGENGIAWAHSVGINLHAAIALWFVLRATRKAPLTSVAADLARRGD